jgi:hypothetical protein
MSRLPWVRCIEQGPLDPATESNRNAVGMDFGRSRKHVCRERHPSVPDAIKLRGSAHTSTAEFWLRRRPRRSPIVSGWADGTALYGMMVLKS